jgi:hypothetical protein
MAHTETLPLACLDCRHVWKLAPTLPMPLDDFAAWLAAIRCPVCGAGADRIGHADDVLGRPG